MKTLKILEWLPVSDGRRRPAMALGLGLLIALALTLNAAAPLQPKLIPADAVWFAQADFGQLKQTQLGKALLQELDRPAIQNRLNALQAAANFDPRKQLAAAAVYGPEFDRQENVIVIQGEVDSALLLSYVTALPEYRGAPHGDYLIHSWPDKRRANREGGNPRTYAAIHTNGTVIISPSAERVGAALDVLDQAKPSLAADANFAVLGDPPAGSFLVVGATQVQLPRIPPQVKALLNEIKAARLTFGEADGKVQANLQLLAPNEETARHFRDILQGVKATLALLKDHPQASQLATAAVVSQNGAKVSVTLEAPAEKVVQTLKALAARRLGAAAER